MRSLIWQFSKALRVAFTGLHVNEASLKRVKALCDGGNRIVLMPLYTSIVDILLHVYIHFHYQMEMPFIFGHKEELSRQNAILAQLGYIFCQRNEGETVQSRYINSAML